MTESVWVCDLLIVTWLIDWRQRWDLYPHNPEPEFAACSSKFRVTLLKLYCSSIQLLSCVQLFVTPWLTCSRPAFPVHHQLPELAQIHVHWVGDAIQPSHTLLPPSPPAFGLSQHQGLFQWVSSSHQVAKYWCFVFSISPSSEYSGLISFRIDWFDVLAVQDTLKSLLQDHSSKASVLRHPAFFTVLLSQPYMATGKACVSEFMHPLSWVFLPKLFTVCPVIEIMIVTKFPFCTSILSSLFVLVVSSSSFFYLV